VILLITLPQIGYQKESEHACPAENVVHGMTGFKVHSSLGFFAGQ